jgi:hypothetical protein
MLAVGPFDIPPGDSTWVAFAILGGTDLADLQANAQAAQSLLSASQVPSVATTTTSGLSATSVTLNGVVNPNGLNTTVTFEFGTTTSYGNSVTATQSPVSGTSDVAVSATVTGLSVATTYHFRVVASNSAGTNNGADQTFTTEIPEYPSTYNLSHSVSFPTRSNASDYNATDYRIIGLPGASNLLLGDFLTGQQDQDWQVFWDNGAANNYFVKYNSSQNFRLQAGRAFWLINIGSFSVNTVSPSPTMNASQEVEIPLQPGWNLITNPFDSAINWSEIQNANSITEPIHSFNGNFGTSGSFAPYVGHYFFNATNLTSLKIPYALLFSSPQSIVDASPVDWQVNMVLLVDEYRDHSASFGVSRKAGDGLDVLDLRKPRTIAAVPGVRFYRPNWDAAYSSFSSDFRPEIESAESWEFEVLSPQRKRARLTFSGIESIPPHLEAYLIEERRGISVNLRADSVYSFTPADDISRFKILVGLMHEVNEELSLVVPSEFELEPNYPNPFSPMTTLSVAIPLSSDVELKIYNILGEEVRTIYSGSLEAGRHLFHWDGRNAQGHNLASGVYLYRFTANQNISLAGKMVLRR